MKNPTVPAPRSWPFWLAVACAITFALPARGESPTEFEREISGRDRSGRWTYSGERLNGQPHGRGVVTWTDGDRFEGSFKVGVGPLEGTMRYASGNTFVGKVSPSYGLVEGTFTSARSNCVFTGPWRNGQLHGQGRRACPGGVSEGQFVAGQLDGNAQTSWPNGDRFSGQYRKEKRHGSGTYRWASGAILTAVWREGQKVGHAIYTDENGRRAAQLYRADQLMMAIPQADPQSNSPECKALMDDWVVLKGTCAADGLRGDVDVVHRDGRRRIRGTFTETGSALGNFLYERLPEQSDGEPVRMQGMPYAPEAFVWARIYRIDTDAQGRPRWVVSYFGDMDEMVPNGKGECEAAGRTPPVEPCEWVKGRRVDAVHLARLAQAQREQAERERRRAEEEREERRRERLARQCERMCPDASERSECEDGDLEPARCTQPQRAQASAPPVSSGNDALRYYQQKMAEVNAVTSIHDNAMKQFQAQLAERQRIEAEQRAAEQRAQRERELERQQDERRRAQAQQQRVAQAEADARRREAELERQRAEEQRAQEARRREEEARRAEAEERARRQRELEQAQARQREQEALRLAQAQEKQRAEEDYLQRLAQGTRLRVINCFGEQSVVAKFPDLSPKLVGCIDLEIKARCTTDLSNHFPVRGLWKNAVELGAGCFGDTHQLQPKLACEVSQIQAEVERAVGCKFR